MVFVRHLAGHSNGFDYFLYDDNGLAQCEWKFIEHAGFWIFCADQHRDRCKHEDSYFFVRGDFNPASISACQHRRLPCLLLVCDVL